MAWEAAKQFRTPSSPASAEGFFGRKLNSFLQRLLHGWKAIMKVFSSARFAVLHILPALYICSLKYCNAICELCCLDTCRDREGPPGGRFPCSCAHDGGRDGLAGSRGAAQRSRRRILRGPASHLGLRLPHHCGDGGFHRLQAAKGPAGPGCGEAWLFGLMRVLSVHPPSFETPPDTLKFDPTYHSQRKPGSIRPFRIDNLQTL